MLSDVAPLHGAEHVAQVTCYQVHHVYESAPHTAQQPTWAEFNPVCIFNKRLEIYWDAKFWDLLSKNVLHQTSDRRCLFAAAPVCEGFKGSFVTNTNVNCSSKGSKIRKKKYKRLKCRNICKNCTIKCQHMQMQICRRCRGFTEVRVHPDGEEHTSAKIHITHCIKWKEAKVTESSLLTSVSTQNKKHGFLSAHYSPTMQRTKEMEELLTADWW